MRPTIAPVPEDYEQNCITSSPESYTGPVHRDLLEMSLDTPVASRGCDTDDAADAARALQELQNYEQTVNQMQSITRPALKRSRPLSIDNTLQENVRAMLNEQYSSADSELPGALGRSREDLDGGRKRVCYSSESYLPSPCSFSALHPAVGGPGGPGMWAGILN